MRFHRMLVTAALGGGAIALGLPALLAPAHAATAPTTVNIPLAPHAVGSLGFLPGGITAVLSPPDPCEGTSVSCISVGSAANISITPPDPCVQGTATATAATCTPVIALP
jgi:hypothetical protein